MAKDNDLEGRQDMGGKHGGQAGMPKPVGESGAQQGIVKDEKGQEQPADKARAQKPYETDLDTASNIYIGRSRHSDIDVRGEKAPRSARSLP